MAYYFMLGVVPLPITPGALSIKTPSMNKTINLVNEGEINIPKDRGLREISFEFLLPQVQKYPFANYQLGSYTATAMIPILNLWKQTKLPFQFIVVRTSPSGKILYFTNIKCLIEDYTYDEDAEEYGLDVMCSINLKEYKDYGTKSVKLKEVKNSDGSTTKTATQTNTRSTTGKTVKSSVKAQDGDTVANIAKKETGSFDNWNKIAEGNNIATPEIDSTISEISGGEDSIFGFDPDNPFDGLTHSVEDKRILSEGGISDYLNSGEAFQQYTGIDPSTGGMAESLMEPVKAGSTIDIKNAIYEGTGGSNDWTRLMGGV